MNTLCFICINKNYKYKNFEKIKSFVKLSKFEWSKQKRVYFFIKFDWSLIGVLVFKCFLLSYQGNLELSV
jgi:hypothetical protein